MRSNVACFAEAVALLVKQPRTLVELAAAMGHKKDNTARRYVRALRDEGLVYIKEWRWTDSLGRGRPCPVWAWQPSVCEMADAPRRTAGDFIHITSGTASPH